ncbi:MAG: replication/maintenance protein RepL [Oscillospiraceae bacterium]
MSDDGGKKVIEKYTTVDDSTGLITGSHTVYKEIRSGTEDPYWKCYDWHVFKGLGDVSFGMLNAVMRRMAYANKDQILFMDIGIKREIAAELNMSLSTVEREIKLLTKCRAIVKRQRSVYMVNPYMFGKGSWASVMKLREKFDTMPVECKREGSSE